MMKLVKNAVSVEDRVDRKIALEILKSGSNSVDQSAGVSSRGLR